LGENLTVASDQCHRTVVARGFKSQDQRHDEQAFASKARFALAPRR
jgi:hypothetical protein